MRVLITPKAKKDLDRLPREVEDVVSETINNLEKNPLPHNSLKLTAQPGYRIRVGIFRILYIIDKDSKLIYIARILHRKEAYK